MKNIDNRKGLIMVVTDIEDEKYIKKRKVGECLPIFFYIYHFRVYLFFEQQIKGYWCGLDYSGKQLFTVFFCFTRIIFKRVQE